MSLDIVENELLAVVGESGCGKSTLALSLIGLLAPNAKYLSGTISYKGTNLASLDQSRLRAYRGTEIAMIFQEPLSSLNPVYRVGDQIAEAMMVRESRKERGGQVNTDFMQKTYKTRVPQVSRFRRRSLTLPAELKGEIIEVLKLVRIPDADQVLDRYPFELSGGMRQRIMIAMALSEEPALLIADEPTTALDVTTQAQVLKLMKDLMDKVKTSTLLITHDLAVASQVAERVVVMYASVVVEDAKVYDLFSDPLHPYTRGLLSCIPTGSKKESELNPIPGSVPDLIDLPLGCRFAPRCPSAMKICSERSPRLFETKAEHKVACFLYGS